MPIHPTAVVHPDAELDANVDVGPYCIIGPHVRIGARSRLLAHVVIDNRTTLGTDNVVHPFARLGGEPQDLKYQGEPSRLEVGNHNVIRENVTLNIGTEHGGSVTRVGSHCLLMAYAHVAHDCQIGDHVVMANNVALGGHVHLGDWVVVGGMVAIHQFCRIGAHAFLTGGSMIPRDVPPFCIGEGYPAQLAGINIIGLRRRGWDGRRILNLRRAFGSLFQGELLRQQTLDACGARVNDANIDVAALCRFVQESSRGICTWRRAPTSGRRREKEEVARHPHNGDDSMLEEVACSASHVTPLAARLASAAPNS